MSNGAHLGRASEKGESGSVLLALDTSPPSERESMVAERLCWFPGEEPEATGLLCIVWVGVGVHLTKAPLALYMWWIGSFVRRFFFCFRKKKKKRY